MGKYNEKRQPQAMLGAQCGAAAPYTTQHDKHPSLSWGFVVYMVRWHFNRMRQAEFASMLGTKQEYVSGWELGKTKVPVQVRSWLMTQLMLKLPEAAELPPLLAKGYPMPSRHERGLQLMDAHGTYGGKGGKRQKKAATAA